MLKGIENNMKTAENAKRRTGVRKNSTNVSRETLAGVPESNKTIRNVANTERVKNVDAKKLYKGFRNNGLSVIESAYNTLYLRFSDKYYSSGVGVKKQFENVHMHPTSWFGNGTNLWKHNKWSVALKLLEIPVVVCRAWHKIKKSLLQFGTSLAKSAEASGSVHKSVSGLMAVVFVGAAAVLGTFWWSEAVDYRVDAPVLQLYIDGEHVGNVQTIQEVNKAKDAVESSISVGLGMPYVLDCSFEYKAGRSERSQLLNEAKLKKVLHEVAHESMMPGYCLYKGDLPVCAVENKMVLENCIQESVLQKYPQLMKEENVQNVGYKDFVVQQGTYPEDLFVDEGELRHLLSLPDSDGEASTNTSDDLTLNKTLMTQGHSVGTSSDVSNSSGNIDTFSVSIEAVITKTEVVDEILPYSTEYIYDDVLPEGLTVPVSSGRNGRRMATYSVDYTDGKETSRRLLSQEVISQPVNAIKKLGTRPLTEEEKQYKSTGTYIYPSAGSFSSMYGWRVLGGSNEFHKGLDMMSDKGLDLVASDGGTVIQAKDIGNGYGLCVLIQHDDGTITRYAHCQELYVAETQKVKQGQLIAKMGSTGFAMGVHVHFEIIKDGATVNPLHYLEPR